MLVQITATKITYYQTGLRTTENFISFIKSSRVVTDRAAVPCFPAGFIFNFYEQYVGVKGYLLTNLLYTAGRVSISIHHCE